jgi:DNA processing protein
MNINKLMLNTPGYPEVLAHIPAPPQALYYAGVSLVGLLKRPRVAIVGSRKISPYGQQVTNQLASQLAEQGVVIVSGLALGVDALAHKAALAAGGTAIAVLPGPLDRIVPTTNRRLAQRILDQGGVLVSEYDSGAITFRQNFVARNRLVSGLADAVLITEAGEKSGSLHTARFAHDQNREVMAVPGNIYAPGYIGSNNLIKASRAHPVTSYRDVMHILGFKTHKTHIQQVKGRNAHEQTILDLMLQGITDGDDLYEQSGLSVSQFSRVITMLEVGSKIRPLGANHWGIY